MDKSGSCSSSPGTLLLCTESIDTLFREEDELGSIVDAITQQFHDQDYIQMILASNHGFPNHEFMGIWVQQARLDGIRYILRKREILGFGYQTAYVSVTYLDRFLSQGYVNEETPWIVILLAMACLSLAAKMEESKLTKLSEFCLEDYNFGSKMIQRVELLVLIELDWKMGTITPFEFIHFFSVKLCDNLLTKTEITRSVQIIIRSMTDLRIMSYKPYVVAAAASLYVMDKRFTRESLQQKINSLSSYLNAEDVISCYVLVEEMNKESVISSELSPLWVQRKALISSAEGVKTKRRLMFKQNTEKKARK